MRVDCGPLIVDRIRALQWYGDKGELEYIDHEKPNEIIESFSPYQMYVETAQEIEEPEPMTPEEHLRYHEEYLKRHPQVKITLPPMIAPPKTKPQPK